MDKMKQASNNFKKTLKTIMNELIENNGIEIFGNLEIEVADMDTPALIKGSTIYVDSHVKKFPKYILSYIVAHELAHLVIKKHSRKFWEIVKQIYPKYEKGKNELSKRYNDGSC